MAQAGNNPGTSGDPGAGNNEGGTQRKIAGKYNTVEEYIEATEKNRETQFHETRQEIGAVKQLLERLMVPLGDSGNGNGNGNYNGDQGYNRGGGAPADDDIDPAEFLSNPRKVLAARDARLQKKFSEEHARTTANMVNNATAVLRFQMKNPDLDEHENLVSSYLKDTDPRDSITKRLTEAGKKTRIYLSKLRGKGDNNDEGRDTGRNPDNDEFVEGAARGDQGNSRQQQNDDEKARQSATTMSDDDLAAEIAEQRKWKSQRFRAPAGK